MVSDARSQRYWSFFPLWYHGDAMATRDTELWRIDMLLDAAFNLLAVLAGLNRLYFARFELKRMRALIAKMEIAPVGCTNSVLCLEGPADRRVVAPSR